jgi:hypothetical protein
MLASLIRQVLLSILVGILAGQAPISSRGGNGFAVPGPDRTAIMNAESSAA